jgi:hypothetical protein
MSNMRSKRRGGEMYEIFYSFFSHSFFFSLVLSFSLSLSCSILTCTLFSLMIVFDLTVQTRGEKKKKSEREKMQAWLGD